ncbi:MAG: DUF1566 domain-containing protein [Gammaproteobacteria bacterium]|nr:DUF1566 domain-containing protein [Gammaproteobacteria bacterium]MDH5694066.1 DUF1566 domain-containing protein [Gammaproteobacteria bacterium]
MFISTFKQFVAHTPRLAMVTALFLFGAAQANELCITDNRGIDNVQQTTPTARFTISEHVVTDNKTGLMWSRCPHGYEYQSFGCNRVVGEKQTFTWAEAMAEIDPSETTVYRGEPGGWRLPNVKELLSIVERTCHDPALNSKVFLDSVTQAYWTNTLSATGGALAVDFNYGIIRTAGGDSGITADDNVTTPIAVRFVRDLN